MAEVAFNPAFDVGDRVRFVAVPANIPAANYRVLCVVFTRCDINGVGDLVSYDLVQETNEQHMLQADEIELVEVQGGGA